VVARGPSTAPPPDELTQPTDLWIIDLASGRERQLSNSPDTWEGWPDWSPDGRRIAFEGDLIEPGNSDVHTIRADGGDLRRLTSRPGYDGDAHYSPDGRSIVFDSDRTGNVDVFVMRDTGAPVRQLTTDPGDDWAGGYSADGNFIAFYSARDSTLGAPDIFRMRADGTQETNLTRTPRVIEFDPDWQP
jgi:TolB protein